MRRFNCKYLNVKYLQKYAKNRIFRPNISAVEKKCVVLTIDCYPFSAFFSPTNNGRDI